jgi:hypothetical protein
MGRKFKSILLTGLYVFGQIEVVFEVEFGKTLWLHGCGKDY